MRVRVGGDVNGVSMDVSIYNVVSGAHRLVYVRRSHGDGLHFKREYVHLARALRDRGIWDDVTGERLQLHGNAGE